MTKFMMEARRQSGKIIDRIKPLAAQHQKNAHA